MCNQINDGIIGVIVIGDEQFLFNLYALTNSLRIPYITIRWDSINDKSSLVSYAQELKQLNDEPINHLNILPPSHKLIDAILDLIDYQGWDFVTVLFHQVSGFNRVEDLIKLNKKINHKVRYQVKQLSSNSSDWKHLLREIKLSGSSHIIVDIHTKYLSRFFSVAEEVGILTNYFHFLFTSLDFSVFDYALSTNLTAYQVYEPNEKSVNTLLKELNLKNKLNKKADNKYIPVGLFYTDACFSLF